MTNENTLIGTTWDYQGVVGEDNYVPVYAGRWKVSDVHGDRAILRQDTCECAGNGKEGSPFYIAYSAKKCIEIPISRLQRDFKRYYAQNIVAEPTDREPVCEAKPRKPVVQRASPVMTNRDIQKSIEDRKNAWSGSDEECNAYIANNGFGKEYKCNGVCKKPSNATGKKSISMISEILDAAFGENTTNKFLDLLKAGSKFGAIATSLTPPFSEWERSPFADALKEANREFDAARDEFIREIRRYPNPDDEEKPICGRSCPKGYENDGPCRKQMDWTPEPRCSNFACEPTIPLKHRRR